MPHDRRLHLSRFSVKTRSQSILVKKTRKWVEEVSHFGLASTLALDGRPFNFDVWH